ncbi:RNase H type-1 domain-containing protein [Fusarium keratoplasticum]|uniref:RNase H type-1 domain-containing protein n=1 Tax=Fusarium keratoplasticum TaxID=1328300 RepID=A0ACC0QBH5_9HYPO|nr:RNase H type-1 domain-containing protein [Fusarium keratoplasticum]KAI8648698.1 RNase H type-1 domain-containing protein [Fusarium keratoplasticum]
MKVHDKRARFTAVNALLRTNTTRAMDSALGQFNDLLRLSRRDELGVRDIIPHLLLQLGREQECYDFLKWWATIDDKDHYNGHYDWDDDTLPFLDIHGADPFEPIDIFCSGTLSLSHLVALTLLKLGLFLDIDAYHESEGPVFGFGYGYDEPDPTIDRPVGRLVRAKMRTMDVPDVQTMADKLQSQYRRLSRMVHDANPYFWEALVAEETPPPPPFCTPGSEEEAHLVLHQCLRAWQETEDAILMIDAETSRFTNVYQGTTAAAALSNAPSEGPRKDTETLQRTRGTGKVFPSRFKPPVQTFPAELFPPTPISHGQMIRFVCRNDPRKVLTYADGACTNNGQLEPSAGWAVVCGTPGNDDKSCIVSGRLEDKGPFGDDSVATSNRAELRAAIAVLRLCDWRDQGYDGIVIATDSTYLVDGATGWAKGWVRKGWKTRTGGNVKNKDLWDLLLGEVERWHHQGLRVDLWKIPRELNGDADAAAKQAARNGAAKVEFEDIMLGSSQTATAETEPGSRILALCLEYESLFDACFGSLVSHITSKAKMERATTPEAALTILDQDSPPSVILVVDGGLTRQRKVWERVIDRLREGATVVLAGCFSSMVNEGEFNRFFAKLGLPWKRGSYHRATVSLRCGGVGDHLASRLPASYSQKALFVQNMERSAAWYTEEGTFDEAAVVIAQVGSGKLGYIGDVNGEEGSDKVVLAMCGLLD